MRHRAMKQRGNPIRSAGKDCTGCVIGSPYTKFAGPIHNPDMADSKWREFSVTKKNHQAVNQLRKRQNQIQEGSNMKKGRKINKVKCDIQSHIIAAGYTQKEAVEACSAEYGWSDSDSNFSAKLSDQTLRYREVLELADVLGYDIVWQKRRDD